MKYDYRLYIYNLYDFSEIGYGLWNEKHPNMLEEGVYYTKNVSSSKAEEMLDEKQFT